MDSEEKDIYKLIKAFWLYGQCLGRMMDAMIERSRAYDFKNKHLGVHFGIMVGKDKWAKEYQRWSKRVDIIEDYVDVYFCDRDKEE